MSKFILAILLFFATAAVVAHGILIYQVNATATLIAEEETHNNHSSGKEVKDLSKEKISFPPDFFKCAFLKKLHLTALNKTLLCSKGFYDKPYNPPEAI